MLANIRDDFERLSQQVLDLYTQGRFADAMRLASEAREEARHYSGENNPDYATALNNLAMLYKAMGNYADAEPLMLRAAEIRRLLLGPDHPEYATSLNSLAMLYRAMGNYRAAEPAYREALEIRRSVFGPTHTSVGINLNNLALLYEFMGRYAAAEPLYKEAMEIERATSGERGEGYAACLNNLARLYRAMGNYAVAEPLLVRLINLRREIQGEEHPDFALALNNLALLCELAGRLDEAGRYFRQALDIRDRLLGTGHPDYAESLDHLARTLRKAGDYGSAQPLLLQSLDARRAALGQEHPDYAASLSNLGSLHAASGEYADAEPLFLQALDIRRTALGEFHPDVAGSLEALAMLLAATGRHREALARFEQASAIDDSVLHQVFSIATEGHRLAYLATLQARFFRVLSLVTGSLPGEPDAARSALELTLRRKAIAAEALAVQRDALHGGSYATLQPKLHELSSLRMQIATSTLAGPGPEGSTAHRALLAESSERKERIESELAREIPEMNLELRLRVADRSAVAAALPQDAALVEYVRFDFFDFAAVPAHVEAEWKPARYAAFVLKDGEPESLHLVDLGDAETIDRAIARFRETIIGEGDTRGAPAQPRATAHGGADAELYALLVTPLLPAIAGRKRLLLAPDGDLTRVPFEALAGKNGRSLIEEFRISYLGTGRDVLQFGVRPAGEHAPPLVAADPDFNLGFPAPRHARVLSQQSRDLHRSSLHLDPLPASRLEGERVASLLGVEPWLGDSVLESRLKDCRSPRILHLATHGFFLPDQIRRGDGPAPENPLLRSFLVLAGANTWLQGGSPPAEAEDGILTAEDVSGLDLRATELAVLSACDTGLGEVRTGEGVFGLRRAFLLAGARTLVMSLWKVPDLPTAILMDWFYDHLLKGKRRDEALHEAQKELRDLTVGEMREFWLSDEIVKRVTVGGLGYRWELLHLRQRDDSHQPFLHPYYWGAFICQGDTAPLDLRTNQG